MSPDDPIDRIDRRVEGLYVSYGALEKAQAVTDERVDTNADNIAAIRADMKELRKDMLEAIGRSEQRTRELVNSVKASCDRGWSDMAAWVEQYEKDEKAKRASDAVLASTSKWSGRMLAVGVASAMIAALGVTIALIALLLGAFGGS